MPGALRKDADLLLGRMTVYYAACCYRPTASGVVCLSVGLSVTLVSPAKTVEPIEMPFGLSTRIGPWKHRRRSHGVQDSGRPQKFACGVFYVSDPHEIFTERNLILECGPMPNVMVALPNIGGALCSTLQSLADAHCQSGVQ